MKIKNKVAVAIIAELTVLLILPFLFINLSKPNDAMGLLIIFFFLIDPIAAAMIASFVGRDIKKLWWIPLSFALVFLFSYWLVLKEIILDLIIYAIVYLLEGVLAAVISWIVSRKVIDNSNLTR